jgi:FeS assembly protein IscX
MNKLNWKDFEDIALELEEQHPDVDPMSVRFTDLRRLVEELDNFEAQPGQHVNEQILEAIQAAWIQERQDNAGGDDEDGGSKYKPITPFKPR